MCQKNRIFRKECVKNMNGVKMPDCYNVNIEQKNHGRKEKVYVTNRQMDILYYLHEQDGYVDRKSVV